MASDGIGDHRRRAVSAGVFSIPVSRHDHSLRALVHVDGLDALDRRRGELHLGSARDGQHCFRRRDADRRLGRRSAALARRRFRLLAASFRPDGLLGRPDGAAQRRGVWQGDLLPRQRRPDFPVAVPDAPGLCRVRRDWRDPISGSSRRRGVPQFDSVPLRAVGARRRDDRSRVVFPSLRRAYRERPRARVAVLRAGIASRPCARGSVRQPAPVRLSAK